MPLYIFFFPVRYIFCVYCVIPGIFPRQVSLQVLRIIFPCFFIHSALLLCSFSAHNLLQKCFLSLCPVFGLTSRIWEFFTPILTVVFHRSESKFPQIFMTLLSIRTDVSNAVVWMIPTPPLISKSSNPCTNAMVTVPNMLFTIGITVTSKFHCLFAVL